MEKDLKKISEELAKIAKSLQGIEAYLMNGMQQPMPFQPVEQPRMEEATVRYESELEKNLLEAIALSQRCVAQGDLSAHMEIAHLYLELSKKVSEGPGEYFDKFIHHLDLAAQSGNEQARNYLAHQYFYLGKKNVECGQTDLAIEYYLKAMARNYKEDAVRFEIGNLYFTHGEHDKAKREFELAAALGHVGAQTLLEQLGSKSS